MPALKEGSTDFPTSFCGCYSWVASVLWGRPVGSGSRWLVPGWLPMARPRAKAMTVTLIQASFVACVWWQGAWEWVQAVDAGLKPDPTSITFKYTWLLQVCFEVLSS